jgi:hypothetical protein
MKSSLRAILFGAFGAALLTLSSYAKSYAGPISSDIILNSEKVQVVHGSTPNTDSTSMTLDITNTDFPTCDSPGDNLIAGGLQKIALSGCSCEDFLYCWVMGCTLPFNDSISSFVSHTISGHQYGTFFSSMEPGGAGTSTLSAKATTLATPMGACGRWTLNLTGTNLNLSSITQSSVAHPIALFIQDGDDLGATCFDIKDAIVGPVIVH